VRIRKATSSDHRTLDVLDQLGHGGVSRGPYLLAAIRAGHCHLAEMDGELVAFIIFDQTFFEQTFIHLLMVHPDHRRQGLGTALMRHVESICSTDKLFTSTNRSNVPMQELCKSLGYAPSGMVENLDEGDPELFFFKRVEAPPSHER
jgi:GNAT superfamily N-acetyltransferase